MTQRSHGGLRVVSVDVGVVLAFIVDRDRCLAGSEVRVHVVVAEGALAVEWTCALVRQLGLLILLDAVLLLQMLIVLLQGDLAQALRRLLLRVGLARPFKPRQSLRRVPVQLAHWRRGLLGLGSLLLREGRSERGVLFRRVADGEVRHQGPLQLRRIQRRRMVVLGRLRHLCVIRVMRLEVFVVEVRR